MDKLFKPMLAAQITNIDNIKFPVFASPKIDGIRCVVRDGIAYSRSNKPIRNKHVQNVISEYADSLNGLDGELVIGNPYDKDVYLKTNSGVMTIDGEPEFLFCIFDSIIHGEPFTSRFKDYYLRDLPDFAIPVEQILCNNKDDLLEFESSALADGYEGVIIRSLNSPYKNNRSTEKEGYLLKLKRFEDAEAVIIGFGELMHNSNEAIINELGHTSRSKAMDGLIPTGKLGYLECKTDDGIEFKIGTGFAESDRQSIWDNKDQYIGKLAKYKYFNHGLKEAPRHPVWIGFRDEDDR